jgi:uncharacterized membrane protein
MNYSYIYKLIRYLFIVILISFIGGTLVYYLYPYFVEETVDTNRYLSCLGIGLLGTFITYNIYLLVFKSRKNNKNDKITKGFFCLFLITTLWTLLESLTFGFHLKGMLLVFFSIGLTCFFIPYVEVFFDKLYLNDQIHNQK